MLFKISSKNQVISYSMFRDNSNEVWNTNINEKISSWWHIKDYIFGHFQLSIFLFFFQNNFMNRRKIFFSSFWYQSLFYNLYFDSWKYEEKRKDQFNGSPTMPEPIKPGIIKNFKFFKLYRMQIGVT